MHQRCSVQILIALCLLAGQSLLLQAADPPPPAQEAGDQEENRTDTDEAEFRQGGIGQQLMSAAGYNPMGGLYGGGASGGVGSAYQQYAAASAGNAGGSGYVNMLRNLYRPPSLGLTDKVKHWVKSFMNRRQYVKPYYNPSVANLQYSADEFGAKPMFVGGANGYKAISVPLRQLQKYYKPYYAADTSGFQPQQAGSAAASGSILSYSPGFYATGAEGGQFAGTGSGLYGGSSSADAALFAAASGAGSSSGSGNLFSGGSSGLFSQGSSSQNLYPQGSSSQNLFTGSEGVGSALFSASGLYGNGGSNGGSGSLYQASSNPGAAYSLDGSSAGLYGSESLGSAYSFGSGGNRGSSSAQFSSSSIGSGPGGYGGDLYASGASPAATVYNPDQGGRYGAKKHPQSQHQGSSYGGGSNSALYMSSSDQRSNAAEPPSSYSAKEPLNSFNVDSSRNVPSESYSVSFQQGSSAAQGKSYGGSSSGFQPVSFGSEGGFQGKSSS